MPPKRGNYGTSMFKGDGRFPRDKPATTANADFFVPTPRPQPGGYISNVRRFVDPQPATDKTDFAAPKGMAESGARTVKIRPGSRFGRDPVAVSAASEGFMPPSFVDELKKKKSGKNAFGTGERFSSHAKPAVSANVEPFVPPSFADVVLQRAAKSRPPSREPTDRFKYQRSATANVDVYVPPSSVVIPGNTRGRISPGPSRFGKERPPASATADFYLPKGVAETRVSTPRIREGSPRFKDGAKSATANADYFVETSPPRSPCPAVACFKDSAPRFREPRVAATAAGYYDKPSFVDEILAR